MSDWKLSDKIRAGNRFKYWFHEEDIKEFIKRLKDKLFEESFDRDLPLNDGSLDRLPLQLINEIIDKIAGDLDGK